MPKLISIALVAFATTTAAADEDRCRGDDFDVEEVREATAAFHSTERAGNAGYALRPGLDQCFDNPGVGGMGYHLINTDILDTELDPEHPEALVYQTGRDGRLHLGAVEYIVPAAAWDASHHEPPRLGDLPLHLEPELGVYVLHAWIWLRNPRGLFEDWNPRVTCP